VESAVLLALLRDARELAAPVAVEDAAAERRLDELPLALVELLAARDDGASRISGRAGSGETPRRARVRTDTP
jgi:hypothetical protein